MPAPRRPDWKLLRFPADGADAKVRNPSSWKIGGTKLLEGVAAVRFEYQFGKRKEGAARPKLRSLIGASDKRSASYAQISTTPAAGRFPFKARERVPLVLEKCEGTGGSAKGQLLVVLNHTNATPVQRFWGYTLHACRMPITAFPVSCQSDQPQLAPTLSLQQVIAATR